MPDPLSALSLASSIAQLVEFVRDVVSDGRQIAKLGATSENEHIQTIANDIGALSKKVTETYRLHSSAQSQDEVALQELGEASCRTATELTHLLENLQINGAQTTRKRKRDAVALSFKSMLKTEEVQKLHNRLESLQQQLHIRLTDMMLVEHNKRILRHQVIDTLLYPEINDRQDAIPNNYSDTYQWIFNDLATGFKTWARLKSGLFWVTGKPGSGKSTLMKYLSNHKSTCDLLHSWAGKDKLVILKHYFWIGGTATQKSESGLLRSLLFQILKQCPEITPLVAPQRILEKDSVQPPWTMPELTETLRKIGNEQGLPIKICIFIDGLDEYDGEHYELVQLLSDLQESSRVKMTVSSRPWNVFTEAFEWLPKWNRIVMQDLTHGDILTYLKGNLLASKRFRLAQAHDSKKIHLMEEIADRSQGVFLWVFLVVRSLLRGLTNGDDFHILRQRVAEFPDSLNEYFQRMLDSTDKVYSVQAARILLAARHSEGNLPLRLIDDLNTETRDPDYDLWLPVSHTSPSRVQEDCDAGRVKRLLDARCRDLLEVVGNRIEFLHRTVKDFLSTHEVHSMLLDRSGPSFDPVVALSKVMLAVIKNSPSPDGARLGDLQSYEWTTARKIRASHEQFLENIGAIISLGLRYTNGESDRSNMNYDFHDCECDCYQYDNPGLPDPVMAKAARDEFLTVYNPRDWLISVKHDLTTTIGAKGCSFVEADLNITCHFWIGSFILLHGHDTGVSNDFVSSKGPADTHVLVARFRDGGHGQHETQRAFIRMAQAIFAQREFFAVMSPLFPSLRCRESQTHGQRPEHLDIFGATLPHFQQRTQYAC